MKIKSGVSLLGLTPQIVLAAAVADSVYAGLGYEAVITSGSEGKHKAKSKHYIGNAIDLRIKNFDNYPDMPVSTYNLARERLAAALPGFDVVLEADHIHVEWDPSGKTP